MIDELGSGVVEYPTGSESDTYTLPLGARNAQPGDVFLIDLLSATRDHALVEVPATGNFVLHNDTPALEGYNVRASTHAWTVPDPVPASVSYKWASAVRGNLGWVHLRGEGDIIVDEDTSSGWSTNPAGEASRTSPSITTHGPNALIYGGLHVGSGSATVTPPAGWTPVVNAPQRKGHISRKGVQALAGATGTATFSINSTNCLRAWQVAFRDTADDESGGVPGAIDGTSTASLGSPAGRWLKPANRALWFHNSKWFSIVPTITGHRFVELAESGDHVLGSVVESSQVRRVAAVYRDGVVYVISFGSDGAFKFGSFNADTFEPIVPMSVPSSVSAPTVADTDATPMALNISENGSLWVGYYSGGASRFYRSHDGGVTWTTSSTTAGIGGSRQGIMAFARTGLDMVWYLTSNDGDGPRLSRIQAEDYTGSLVGATSRTTGSLPSGTTPDDHLSMCTAPDGTVIAVAKTTNNSENLPLIYMQTLPPGQASWTAPVIIETAPDDISGYSRPSVTIAYDRVQVYYGTFVEPYNLYMRWAPLSDLTAWSTRDVVMIDGDFSDSAQTPDPIFVRQAGAKYPILTHDRTSKSIIAAWMDTRNPSPAPSFEHIIVGAPDHESISVAATVVGAASTARLKVATNVALTENVVTGLASTADGDGRFMLYADGLESNTLYHYGIEAGGLDGYWYPTNKVGESRTIPAPDELTPFSFGFGSCFNSLSGSLTSPTSGSFGRLAARDPDFWFDLGDKHYADNSSTSQSSHRNDIIQTLTFSTAKRDLSRTRPVIPLNSDHDAGGANNSFPGAYTPANRAANLQMYPFRERPNPDGLYHAFTVGNVRFIITDTRYFAQVGVTRLGSGQKAWFKEEMKRPEPVKVWVQEATWIDNKPNGGEDKWQDFPAEKAELGTFFATEAVGQVVTIHGDQHALAADDGSHNPWGGFPSFCAAPWRQLSSLKTLSQSDWSEGFYPTTLETEVAQYGWCDVTYAGNIITLAFKGYDTSNTLRVQMDIVVDTTPEEPTGVLIKVKEDGVLKSYRILKIKTGTGGIRAVTHGAIKQGGVVVPLQ